MKSVSRRRVLLVMGAVPVIALSKRLENLLKPKMTVGEAMRYLCEEVFPTSNEKSFVSGLDRESQSVTRAVRQFHIDSVERGGFA
ncbi:hypothetical protein [Cupriavidus pauculus]